MDLDGHRGIDVDIGDDDEASQSRFNASRKRMREIEELRLDCSPKRQAWPNRSQAMRGDRTLSLEVEHALTESELAEHFPVRFDMPMRQACMHGALKSRYKE